MQHFYDGQIRRYITQTIRVFSNFVVKYGDGSLHRIPVMYGDTDRQVATIIRGNSENKVNSTPRIAVYVTGLDIDKDRLSDSSFVSRVNIRERDTQIDNDPQSPTFGQPVYNQAQGRNYTVERLMPTPFKLTMKVDIWAANTDQKLQIIEQILVLFNPSLELQTNSNFVDWTSLSVLNMTQVNWSSRTVPVGNDSPIDIATLTVETPIWISPPVKVKHLGVITKIVTSLFGSGSIDESTYIDGFGPDLSSGAVTMSDLLSTDVTTIGGYNINVFNTTNSFKAELISFSGDAATPHNWQELFDQYPGQYIAGSSTIYITQADGSEINGTVAIDPIDNTILNISPNPDLLQQDETILTGNPFTGYVSLRTGSPSTFDAIIDPTRVYPDHGMVNPVPGDRFLIIEDIMGNNAAWGNFTAKANDIIEFDGTNWHVLFDAVQEERIIIQANIYNNVRVQYTWNNVSWIKRFDGEYKASQWRIVL
jgi:T4-like virus Myoviridae tail sheath stabiliser